MRFEVDDPDNGDEEYSVGDVLVIGFNMDTNAPSCSGSGIARVSCPIVNGSVVSTALTDHLFSFSDPIGADYSGEWATPRRFMVTILDPTGADVEQGRTTVFVQGGIRNAAGDALSADNQTSVLFGDFGYLTEPRVERLTVVMAENKTVYTDGDTLVLHLDMATRYSTLGEAAPTSGDKAFVDHLFGFSDVLGADYSGAWHDGESAACDEGGATTLHPCFVILLLDARTGAAASGRTIAAPSVHMRSGSGKSARLVERLGGNFGWRRAPQLVSLVAADADNSAFGVSEGDTLTISFDLPTDTGVDPPQPWGSGVGVGVTAGDKVRVRVRVKVRVSVRP